MFKLESYLTPWLLGYLDKYVKLKPEDFQLSLWGGDAVFNKLDLRLNVIENLTNIPITFKSGVIHELRIHIPWTRITSEPVVVTINTLEFVAKLKNVDSSNSKTSQSTTDTSFNKSESSQNIDSEIQSQQQQQQQQQGLQPIPTGYIQNIISKILFNICIIINNVIVKFVEDDMVLSINMKSAECFSVNNNWEKTYVDVNAQNIHLRKILQLNDVTICLDKLDNKKSTKISFYQDPLIYRCSIESRLDFKYSMNSNNFDDQQLKLMKLNFYCRKFDVSITDQQLPMVIRLIELIMAIVDGSLKLTENEFEQNEENFTNTINDNIKRGSLLVEELKTNLAKQTIENEYAILGNEQEQQQGWVSWAWSYVPSVSSLINEPTNDTIESQSNSSNDIKMIIGCYFDEFNLSFKLTNQNHENNKSNNFINFLLCNTKGIALEVNKKKDFSHILFGISYICLKSVGECCCKLCPKPSQNEIVFLKGGTDYLEDKIFHYLTDSLFDLSTEETSQQNESQPDDYSGETSRSLISLEHEKSRDKLGNIDENYGLKRFGAIFMDNLNSAKNLNKSKELNDDSEMDINLELDPDQPDIFSLFFIFYGIEINISANLIHRAVKVFDCTLNHSYTEPYSMLKKLRSDSNMSESLIDDLNSKMNTEKLARKFEKYIPIINQTFTFKNTIINFHPYSHFLIAPIASQDSNYECYLRLNANNIYFSISRPLDEKTIFDVVSKLPNPSKKLIYESYIHNQLTADSLKLNLVIVDSRSNFRYESVMIEPCYFEFHFSNVIMSPEMWNKQYFPLKEFILELPVLKLNLNKQIMFILYDYLDHYLFPLLNQTMITQIKHPFINKSQMKKAKLRQMIYKRLLIDYIQSVKFKKADVLSVCINDIKLKYSITKIMQIIQLNCNMCNIYLLKNDQTEDDLIQIIETSNKTNEKNNNIKDFLVLRAQLPLTIDSENSYIPDPLFVYLNINEINVNIQNQLLNWLNYIPKASQDDDLLNLLVLELFDDVTTEAEINENVNLINKLKLNTQKQKFSIQQQQKNEHKSIETASSSSIHLSKSIKSSTSITHSIRQIKLTNKQQHQLNESNLSVLSTSSQKATIIDTLHDLLKALHLQITIKPISVQLTNDEFKKNIFITLPQIDAKSSGTKCDLEEELINSKLVQLPCSYLRACEKTSSKIPWLVELKGLKTILTDQSEHKKVLLTPIDFNTVFSVKPKYQQYNNLLSSMSIIINMDISKKIDINIERVDLDFLTDFYLKIESCISNFEYRIDYKELEKINMFEKNEPNVEWDENKSFSTISILKEYELSSFDDEDENESRLNSEDFYEDHCSLSTGELSSSSSSNLEFKQKRRLRRSKVQVYNNLQNESSKKNKMSLLSPVVHLIQRERNEDQVKINFSLNFLLLNLNLNLIDKDSKMVKFNLNRLLFESDLNNIYQKFSIKLKKFDIFNQQDGFILNTNVNEENFLEFVFTNALISNVNRRLSDLNDSSLSLKSSKTRRLKSKLNLTTRQKWINEIDLSLKNVDFNLNIKKLNILFNYYLDIRNLFNKSSIIKCEQASKKYFLIPIIKASDVPLISIDLKKVKFIISGFNNKDFTFQFQSFNISSQIENPLIRNFINNSTSLNIYNKAKSSGMLYRPGFVFEDRQYLLYIKNISLSLGNKQLIEQFDLKFILALPILFGKRLINGYAIELSIPSSNININLSNNDINLLYDSYNENMNELNKFDFNLKDSKKKEVYVNKTDENLIDLEIVPLDILATAENITLSLYLNDNLMLNTQLIQPHICFFMHEKIQKFEISIFDIYIKRGSSLLVLETKTGEPNPKNGILSGFLSFKIHNFSSLFCFDTKSKINEINHSNNNRKTLVCVCNSCLRCYQFKNVSTQNQEENLSTQLLIERPVKIKFNTQLYDDIIMFINSLKLKQTEYKNIQTNSNSNSNSDDDLTKFILQIMFSLNIQLITSQILFAFETSLNKQLTKFQTLNFSLNNLNICLYKTIKDDELSRLKNPLINYLLTKQTNIINDNSINHFNLKLNDFNINLIIQNALLDSKNDSYLVHFLGPVTIKSFIDYDLNENELNSFIDFGSFYVTFNRLIFDFTLHMIQLYEIYFVKKNQNQKTKPKSSNLIKMQKDTDLTQLIMKHEDDLRNGSLKYKIIDDNYFKKLNRSNDSNSIDYLLSHVQLPNTDEIVCVDDLNQTILASNDLTSSVTWSYAKKRALISLKILPLPLVGNSVLLNVLKDDNEQKLFIEYFNDCSKMFVVLKEFSIKEGVYTNVIDIQNYMDIFKDLVYSKIWRIRLSKEAKRYIFASSLLASTRVDSIELDYSKKLFNSSLQLSISNIELKLNSIKQSFSQADLALINLNDFSGRILYNQANNSNLTSDYLTINFYGQLSIDYCEYQFLTYRSLIDSFQFRYKSLSDFIDDKIDIYVETDTINILTSQSALIGLKQIENEFNYLNNIPTSPPHYYMIFNDTSLDLNIKQFDTEETCLIRSGDCQPYIWRTHKKAQLLQLFIPKYKLTSNSFQINENGIDEISIQLADNFKIDFIINIESNKFNPSTSWFKYKNIDAFKKYVFIQTKFLCSNYTCHNLNNFNLKYKLNKEFYLNCDNIAKFSRSKTSLEFIQSSVNHNLNHIISIELNKKCLSLKNLFEKLQDGLLWEDESFNTKFWINLHEHLITHKSNTITQYSIIFSPVFVLCSYLPYDLSLSINESIEYSIKPDSISYFNENIHSNQISVKFENFKFNKNNFLPTLNESTNQNWFLNEVILLTNLNFNQSACFSFENKTLIHVDLFKYISFVNYDLKQSEIDINIIRDEGLKKIDLNKNQEASSIRLNEEVSIKNNFLIQKSNCWGFSPTIRIDIKPECLIVNSTGYQLKLYEKIILKDETEEEIVYEINQNGGKLCISEIGLNSVNLSKKYKLSITLDEYSLVRNEHVDLKKEVIEYESDWFDIKDEPVSPFYRERFTTRMNCLYLNKCWIDLKLFPKNSNSRFKLIYLVMSSEDKCLMNRNFTEIEQEISKNLPNQHLLTRIYESTYRLLNIQPKFLIKNKTKKEFKFKLMNDFNHLMNFNSNKLHKYVQVDDVAVSSGSVYETGSIIDHSNFYINESHNELNEYEIERDNLNDLFYLSLDDNAKQSKPLILTCKEKSIKQITSTGQHDDNLLVSHQCFCIYEKNLNTPEGFILTQKLLVNKTGQLLIILKEDQNQLVNLYNDLDFDLLVWPRLSTNFIFENYIRNTKVINEKLLNDKFKHQKIKQQNEMDNINRNSLIYMHLIPKKSWFKFNYDFIGTNNFPIENINEQIFFMFAKPLNNKSDLLYDLSPNLCKIYDSKTELSFETNKDLKIHFISIENSFGLSANRFLTLNPIDFKPIIENTDKKLNVIFNLNIERLTLALNDDYLSQTYQTEILRLTIDNLVLKLDKNVINTFLNIYLRHLQLDNQMYHLNESDLSSKSQKYDFPVIFIPRVCLKQTSSISKIDYFKSFEWNFTPNQIENQKFLEIKLIISNSNLTDLDLTINPFDLYLEDYLIYNLTKIGLDFLEFASLDTPVDFKITNDDLDLDLLIKPAILIKKLSINKIDALVSLQTSIKLYLATYKMPILFDDFKLNGLPVSIMSSPQLIKLFTTHYLTSLLFRAGWLLGSLDLIGSPTAFIQQVSNGVFDFLQLPYRGLRNSGPTGLLHGFSNGSLSLIRNLSAGTITSLTSFASFVSRNMDILSFDPYHLARQEQFRHQTSDSISSGLLQVSSSFIISIMGAIGGLAEQPIQSVHNSDSLIKGVSKGLIGLVTKPVGAVAELVNQTGQGLLKITGVNRLPLNELRLQRKALNKEFSRFLISSTKFLWKLLNSTNNKIQINAMIEAVYTNDLIQPNKTRLLKDSSGANLTPCYLVLSDDILYILDKNEDMLLRAFYISQIDVKTVKSQSQETEAVLCVCLNNQKVESFMNEYQRLYENTIDRLVDYVLQTNHSEDDLESSGGFNFRPFQSEYYQFENIPIGAYFIKNSSLPCVCGTSINFISLEDSKKVEKVIEKSDSREKAVSEIPFNDSSSQKHLRQNSSSEIPKIHRMHSNPLNTSNQSNKQNNSIMLQSQQHNTHDIESKKFYYYVDPRLSINFISIFNSLKRKASNKGFHF